MALVVVSPGGAVAIAVTIPIPIPVAVLTLIIIAIAVTHPRAVWVAAVLLHLTRGHIAVSPSGLLALVPTGRASGIAVPVPIAIMIPIPIIIAVLGAVPIIAGSVASAVALPRKERCGHRCGQHEC